MRYFIFAIIFFLTTIGAFRANTDGITSWLLGINFTLAFFSINFTFFGQQLSKYKSIYNSISRRQWFNITTLFALPFLPLICFLLLPEYFGQVALFILPLVMFSAIDNALLTENYLNPIEYIDNITKSNVLNSYLNRLSKEVENEVNEHQLYLDNKDKFQIPIHAYDFEPSTIGCKNNDIWDSITIIIKLSLQNNDYPIFKKSIDSSLKLLIAFYSFEHSDKDNYRVNNGIKIIARNRLSSLINFIKNNDKDGIFLQTLSNELCRFLLLDNVQKKPCSELARAVALDVIGVSKAMIESDNLSYPLKVLNTIHSINEINIYRLENSDNVQDSDVFDKINISMYANDIKELGIHALKNSSNDFAYRCMESLSYLGCNAAKLKSSQTVQTSLESIVQMGRVARSLDVDCFWHRCLIPIESHAEEFMGHILTWMIKDMNSEGDFFMKEHAEQAYSRLRGVQCSITYVANRHPCFWIKELKDSDDKTIPHIERESGMFGYNGELDYSKEDSLKEYTLRGISPSGGCEIIRTAPIPIKFELDDSKPDT